MFDRELTRSGRKAEREMRGRLVVELAPVGSVVGVHLVVHWLLHGSG